MWAHGLLNCEIHVEEILFLLFSYVDVFQSQAADKTRRMKRKERQTVFPMTFNDLEILWRVVEKSKIFNSLFFFKQIVCILW